MSRKEQCSAGVEVVEVSEVLRVLEVKGVLEVPGDVSGEELAISGPGVDMEVRSERMLINVPDAVLMAIGPTTALSPGGRRRETRVGW
jgi:hypothetical protein